MLGLAMGAVWATGFASVDGAEGTTGQTIVDPSPGQTHLADLRNAVTAYPDYTFDWDGANGSVADTDLFKVDLDAQLPGDEYNVGVKLANGPAINTAGWASLQLRLSLVSDPNKDGDCTDATYDGLAADAATRLMVFDYHDASVYWNGLAGDDIYCVGIKASTYPGELDGGGAPVSTFIAAADRDNLPTVYPQLITTVDRSD